MKGVTRKSEEDVLVKRYDYLIAGGGIIGLTIARELKRRYPEARIAVIEKEPDVAKHSSGRNSGVLHAGFYYTADSLKAKFTRDGNEAMQAYCREHGLKLNRCGKLVVATDESELAGLEELKRRAERNGVELIWVDEEETVRIDPNVKTFKKALYSPNTASVDPVEVCMCIKKEVASQGVDFFFDTAYAGHKGDTILTNRGPFGCGYFINSAGLYADKVAHDFGFGRKYTIIPFKGIYLKYAKNKSDVRTNIYPVPNLNNPFLGVHYTKTVDGSIKIGPTAIPAFWRENYKGLHRFKMSEFFQILFYEAKLFWTNSFHFRRLAVEEMKKYNKANFIGLSLKMIKQLDPKGFGDFLRPGIRAQLLDKQTLELVQDFVLEGDSRSMHILNAVSPAFTCSLPFAAYVADQIEERRAAAPAAPSSQGTPVLR
ncbi:L-2-hydroxyglutarate oxidase [Paenibacillus sp. IB182363]|uniref:L-2-hydroxyglutarate oxidase n=1 Tax=Paenibacillus oceani TaxID=2772510 RepID=A0A927H0N4_9BACL|nr:L-2-hydroxyglutarate oxidase [Paenibacillus oceani]